MRPETIARTYRVPSQTLETVHNICERQGVRLSDIVRRYAQFVVRTRGEFLRSAPRPESSQLNVRMPFDLAHSFSLVCKQSGSGTNTTVTSFLNEIVQLNRIPEELLQESAEDVREYIRKERARLDTLEAQLGK
ncbi:hypothetical protein MPK67_gp027 [Erwinia phage pEa_SNUABM_32]|uniref:Uncharacterized protein n=2 Tax=Alexandravirus TaxID=2733088 RepID=A0AAE7XJ07_9CAUD|nr:hypothetical protein MPK67_gp027 [Erwinia phage pEa_SNUABM_32]YP_010301141.1 hypothetical protein MPK68_gp028 [Erwinia phage pEa_SNUABM_3]QZE56564.1 hypothetical protein pEaSNUABM20_00028 [Erwinia phage pEa_SNUABM_20]QZE58244.1 hypothetical protein pEaSNUABM40_00028 [Erwinia phage pEa_SNUABM_40]UAW52810.1 hypothetical protein pEaSNUABM23_00028 [Erwinia phage pEa_SNUABM_23]UIW10706.1 hypothetical protein pEaSNUABM23_00028 [Erwinia phage pEa_SNUABM_31]QZE56225.1 hypothetical protein pEaSNUAB